jgi:hypothetical protein
VDRLWPSGSRSTIFGAEVCSCCMCTCVVYASAAAQGASKYTSLEYLGSLAVAPWRGKVLSLATPPKMTSSVTANPSEMKSIYCNSPIANILHMYTGKIMLSFCPDMASRTDPSPMIIPYRTTLQKRSAGASTS